MKKNKYTGLLPIIAAGIMLVACAGGPPKPVELRGDLVTSDSINPNRDGRASPVTVVIYYLKDGNAFMTLDFFNLYDPDSGALAADLIQRTDVQVAPGQTLPLASEFDPETTHIGVLAAFRDIDNAQWRAIIAVPEKGLKDKLNLFSKKKLVVTVDTLSVSAVVE